MKSAVGVLLACAMAVTCLADEPQGPEIIINTRVTPNYGDGAEPQPPGTFPNPDTDGGDDGLEIEVTDAFPTPDRDATLGDRCPFPADEDGQWPGYCYDVIGENCECFFDDIVISQEECIAMNKTEYEELLKIQMDLEEKRDREREQLGLGPRGSEIYLRLTDCYSALKKESTGKDNSASSEETK